MKLLNSMRAVVSGDSSGLGGVMLAACGIFLMLALDSPVLQQEETGTLMGQVTDSANAPIEGATVTLTELKRKATTDYRGYYMFNGLPAGEFSLSVRRIGYTPLDDTVTVIADTTVTRNLKLSPVPPRD